MKETYLSRDFRETAAQCFPSQAKELNAFFDARLNVLLAENADASKEKQYHLKRQILPGIAAYETLQRVMPKEEALQTVHGYVEELARTSHKQLAALLHIPGLYRLVPGVFVKSTRSVFGPAAGFDSKELQVGNGIWRVDTRRQRVRCFQTAASIHRRSHIYPYRQWLPMLWPAVHHPTDSRILHFQWWQW